MAGRVLGTTDYVSPEQALGQPVTPQSDLYSLGIVLYEMLTGDVPFHGETPVAVAMKHVREDVPDVQARRPEISAATASVIDRSLAKDLSHRYPDAAAMVSDLEHVLAIEASRTGPDDRRGDDGPAHAARARPAAAAVADAPPGALAGLARGDRRDRGGRDPARRRQRPAGNRRAARHVLEGRARPREPLGARPPTATTRSAPGRKTAIRSATSSTATPRRPGPPRPTTKATCSKPGGTGLGIYLDAAPGRRRPGDRDPDADAGLRRAVLRRRPHRPLRAVRKQQAACAPGAGKGRSEPARRSAAASGSRSTRRPARTATTWCG